ncbi:hypothetical protein GH714_027270 [Hevea brasiliensis]|uniref:Uncharacterized protein n=1 Tax=Hevea brasiliensis TaxID=3981 RepID=A0A6A6K990_HEVBR|nr:hypothetical protein GH714_027270 [Hevea brasiliensis]
MGREQEVEAGGEEYLFKIVLIEFQTQVVDIDGKEIKAQIWDTAGKRGLELLPLLTIEVIAHCDTAVARMLVGNKCDLENIRETAFEVVIREIYNNVSKKILNSDSYKVEFDCQPSQSG